MKNFNARILCVLLAFLFILHFTSGASPVSIVRLSGKLTTCNHSLRITNAYAYSLQAYASNVLPAKMPNEINQVSRLCYSIGGFLPVRKTTTQIKRAIN